MNPPEVVALPSADLLARSIAARLVTKLVDAQAARGSASVVLTGGGLGISTLRDLRDCSARDAVDWSRVDVWWGDERFVPSDDADRNDVQARAALLDAIELDPVRVHAFAASDGELGEDPESAAAAYAELLSAAARPEDHAAAPRFDVLMLGVGEEGHIASIFPESPAAYEDERTVVAVHGSPKPPPTRLSLTFPAIASATEVWLCTAGASKSSAVAMALGGAGPIQVPAAGARGRSRTLWLLDRAAASRLPANLVRLPLA
ncbi:MAG: 6-phosphogluconolactonase [Mycobacteriales bacterium]|nr:MAG: 6-phosphogluconolactonase [Pseudonocardiales bacterium]